MSSASKKLMGTTAAGGGSLAIEDVFSTYLWTGTGVARDIVNGIDLAGEGGLTWIKCRTVADSNSLFTTDLGANKTLLTDAADAQDTVGTDVFQSFNSDGFRVGVHGRTNESARTYASWTFRKAPRFFDVVTWTGDGAAQQTINHSLGVAPGMIVSKRLDSTSNWSCFHRGIGEGNYIFLNSTNPKVPSANSWINVNSDTFDAYDAVNLSGATYVAYLFAHDPLGPSGDGSDGLIACGSYTGNGTSQDINLGWEPQWILTRGTSVDNWPILDNMRGIVTGGADARLYANTSAAEEPTTDWISLNATGYTLPSGTLNASGEPYIYIAIRRGPMRAPTSGTEVFAMDNPQSLQTDPGFISGFPVDLGIFKLKSSVTSWYWTNRVAGEGRYLESDTATAEQVTSSAAMDYNNGWWDGINNTGAMSWMFRRAPEFFDAVAYSGDGVAGRTVPHNLGVAPEMMIVKTRSNISNWAIYHSAIGPTKYLQLPGTQQANTSSQRWNDTSPAADVFTVGNDQDVNTSGWTYIAYLFATLPGVSKVGSYTGNSGTQTIDCGFTTGARFVMVKAANTSGAWFVWDTARGIIEGTEPYLRLNSSVAEENGYDAIDPHSSGFTLNNVGTGTNDSGTTYIFYAVS